jgi:hypothetical protein
MLASKNPQLILEEVFSTAPYCSKSSFLYHRIYFSSPYKDKILLFKNLDF